MRTTSLLLAGLVLGFANLVASVHAGEKATSKIHILVPPRGQEETLVFVNNKKLKGEGEKRVYSTQLEKGKEVTFEVRAEIEPNNYTKITRIAQVKLVGGEETTIDLTKKSKSDKIKVRWVPTPDDIVDKMSELAKITKNDTVYDLGCGDAVMLIRPILKNGAKKGVGIDIDKKMIEKAKEKAKEAGVEAKLDLRVGDILNVKDMSDADVVLLYIGDDLGERLSPVLRRSLKPGARVVSHRFTLGDWEPTRTVNVTGEDGFEYTLHLWIMEDKK